MHSACLGLTKRLIESWLKDYPTLSDHVNQSCKILVKNWPIEFQRTFRSLKFFSDFKATELRYWLLYIGKYNNVNFLKTQISLILWDILLVVTRLTLKIADSNQEFKYNSD